MIPKRTIDRHRHPRTNGSGDISRTPAPVRVLAVGPQTLQRRLRGPNVDRIGGGRKRKKEDTGKNGVSTAAVVKRMLGEVF